MEFLSAFYAAWLVTVSSFELFGSSKLDKHLIIYVLLSTKSLQLKQLVLFRKKKKVFWPKYTKPNRISHYLLLEQYFRPMLFICYSITRPIRIIFFQQHWLGELTLRGKAANKPGHPLSFHCFQTVQILLKNESQRWMLKAYLHVSRNNYNQGDTH